MQTLKKLLYFLSEAEKKNAAYLLILSLIMALIDMIGVASILPFIAVLTNPDLIETNFILKLIFEISQKFGVLNHQQFFIFLGVLVFLILIFSLTFKAITTYLQLRFIKMRQHSIAIRIARSYLCQPYHWFLHRSSSDIAKNILSEVGQIVGSGLSPLINLVAQSMLVISIILLLVLIDPKLALFVGFVLCLCYSVIYKFIHNYLGKIGKERFKVNKLRFKAINEAFNAVKEVKLNGLEETYIKKFNDPSKIFSINQAISTMLGQLPRFFLEALAFGGMMIVILYLIITKGKFSSAIPIIALYAFAGYRLIPALQKVYISITQIRFVGPVINSLYYDFTKLETNKIKKRNNNFLFKKAISLENICYNYPKSSRKILSDINLTIKAGSKVGLLGDTGSGKTTIIDLVLSLLKPSKGYLKVDNNVIDENNQRDWQSIIGYVPQSIYLSDDSIEANIAFGEDPEKINHKTIERVSKVANLHNFVENELPKKYKTIIGERGIRLSGGQRQRIGIARALYNNPKILVLDEATSALDDSTEKSIMEGINNLGKDITIIMIAHRLNSLKICDKLFKIHKGQIINQGSYDELIKNKNEINLNE